MSKVVTSVDCQLVGRAEKISRFRLPLLTNYNENVGVIG